MSQKIDQEIENAAAAATAAAEENTNPDPNQDPLVQAQEEAARWKDTAMRTQADLENYRKRVVRDREEDIRRAQTRFIEELIPVIDNFEFGMMEVRKGDPKSPIVVGMQMIERQLKEFMAAVGMEVVEVAGVKFDPNLHEAVGQEDSAEIPEGHIIRQMRRGFVLKDRLLRPSMVVVSKGAASADNASAK